MSKTRLISPGSIPNHRLLKNLRLNDKYISNDGGDEGIRITDAGLVGMGVADPDTQLEVFGTSIQLKLSYDGSNYTEASVKSDGELHIETYGTDADILLEGKGDVHLMAHDGDIFFSDSGGIGTSSFLFDVTGDPHLTIRSDSVGADTFKIQVNADAATEISTNDSDGTVGHLKFDIDGHVEFEGCAAGFDLTSVSYDASDTNVDFRLGNKAHLTLTGNVADLNLFFPDVEGNFTLLLIQDGTGNHTIATDGWLAFDHDEDAASGSSIVLWPGGTEPTITAAGSSRDIVSFFWDGTRAYGVISQDFK